MYVCVCRITYILQDIYKVWFLVRLDPFSHYAHILNILWLIPPRLSPIALVLFCFQFIAPKHQSKSLSSIRCVILCESLISCR